jgi:hypothetical protein
MVVSSPPSEVAIVVMVNLVQWMLHQFEKIRQASNLASEKPWVRRTALSKLSLRLRAIWKAIESHGTRLFQQVDESAVTEGIAGEPLLRG